MNCNKPSCSLCKIDREGCQCLVKDVGCWYCAPNKFNRPECETPDEFHAFKKSLYDQVEAEIKNTVEHYAVLSGRLQDHVYAKQEKMLAAPTSEEATKIFKRLMTFTINSDALYLWAKKRARGPPSKRTSDVAAKKAESLAKLLEEKGEDEKAKLQRERAAKIREELHPTNE